jgi:DNA invertase Pin-like site-specific DNA recombinase
MNEKPKDKKWVHCAIYTRKSTSEGLEQEFTSLDNQRESAESYITSQKHEGWVALPDRYDDGGFTGANIERPALQKLLNDIKEGKINCVVVYKVDRLSRSLLDFSQLLEFFDKNNVTFVSITQQFNTNTSMGRLTLNVLLSFAQFEREIISERTKDKMGAARKRGQWLGGRPPFGYTREKDSKKLTINPEEASIVKEMFKLYIDGNSLIQVAQILNNRGLRSRQWVMKNGKTYGGKKYGVTQIQSLIKNVLYIGKVKYAGQIYDGQHEGILDEETFKKTQEQLKVKRVERKVLKNTDCTGLLNHLLHCPKCNAVMFHTYTLKPNQHKYRYYVCTNAQKRGYSECPTKSLNAQAIENAVIGQLKLLFANRSLTDGHPNAAEMDAINSPVWNDLFPEEKRKTLKKLVERVEYTHDIRKLSIILKGIDKRFDFDADLKSCQPKNRWHKELEINKEPAIVKNLILARQISRLFDEGRIRDFKQAAVWLNMSPARVSQLMSLNFLSTEIQESILTLPSEKISTLSDNTLREIASEVDWQKQSSLWHKALN